MTVDQEGVLDVARDNCQFVYIDIVDVVDNVNTATLRRIGWFDNPHITFGLHGL